MNKNILTMMVLVSAGMSYATNAHAACSTPAGVAGDQFYNTTHNVMQFCNGTDWINMGAPTAASGDNLGNHTATQTIVSDTHNTDDLGTTAIRWKDGWFAGTVTGGIFSGSGASLTALNASNLTTGTVGAARLGTGTADGTTYLRGDGTWATPPSGADNLGDHTATQALAMGGYAINNSGNINVGASGTSYELQLHDAGTNRVDMQISNSTTGATATDGFVVSMTDNDVSLSNRENGYMGFNINGTERMRLTTNGDLEQYKHLLLRDGNGANSKTAALLSWDDTLYFRRHDTAGTYEANVANLNLLTGTLTATAFVGDGSGLTGISGADNLGAGGTTTGYLLSQNASGYGYVGSAVSTTGAYNRFDDSPAASAGRIYTNLLGTWEYVTHPDYFGPYTTAVNDLGTTSVRWQDGWFSGTVTAANFSGSGAGLTNVTVDTPTRTTNNYTTAGANTWTKPAGAELVFVECWGGGGAGAKGVTGGSCAQGGGGGGYASAWFLAADLTATVTVTVGATAAGRTTAGAGADGNASTFGAYLTAGGGQGGLYYAPGSCPSSSAGAQAGGTATIASTAAFDKFRQYGGNGGTAYLSGSYQCTAGQSTEIAAAGGGGNFTCAGGTSLEGGDGGAGSIAGAGGDGGNYGGGGGGSVAASGASGDGKQGKCSVVTVKR
jgi:hypothetical protein